MLNVIAIMGRLVADPTVRQTQTGKKVAAFRIACDRGRKDAGADFFEVVAWEKSADFVCTYFSKGDLILVDGRLSSRNYEDKNGAKRTAYEIVANNINFAGKKQSKEPDAPVQAEFDPIEDGDDLPF